MSPAAPESDRLAFKAYEIEELADVYFFRPFGMVFARAARALGMSPTAVTWVATAAGMIGGALLASPDLALLGFGMLILYGVLDSSDGQLARMTGRSSEFGRFLDGVSGYLTYIAIYAAILYVLFAGGASSSVVWVAVAAGLSTIMQMQMYDYHRTTYTSIAIKGQLTRAGQQALEGEVAADDARARQAAPTWSDTVLAWYGAMQHVFAGAHARVETAVARRNRDGRVSEEDRALYRRCFYVPVRGWNVLGDNTRFYAIGVLAWMHHVDWFLGFVLGPMNVALVALWIWQGRADRRFLTSL